MHLRSKKKASKEISLYEPIGTDREGNEIKLYDIIETDDVDVPEKNSSQEKTYRNSMKKSKTSFPPEKSSFLKMRYGLYNGEEYTQREIARQIGISRSYVSRIEKSAIQKLREHFKEKE